MNSCFLELEDDFNEIIESRFKSAYVFRTRIERLLIRLDAISIQNSNKELKDICTTIRNKLVYLSDHSNQTPDGILSSYTILENDLILLKEAMSH